MSQTPQADSSGEVPTVDPDAAEKLIAEATAGAAAAEGERALNQAEVEALRGTKPPERTEFPPTPVERALGPEAPTVRKTVMDAAWLANYPDINFTKSQPSEEDKIRYALCLIKDLPFMDRQTMIGGDHALNVDIETVNGEMLELQYDFLAAKKLEDNRDRYFSELQYAGAALQVRAIGDQKFTSIQNIQELEERVKQFKKWQNHRWALVLLAVRQSMLKCRLLAEMIANYDDVFTKPAASASQ